MTAENLQHPAAAAGCMWSDLLAKLGPLIGLAFVFGLFAILRPKLFAG